MKKNNIIKLLTLLIILVGVQKNVNAQLEQSVYINGIAPVGQFNRPITFESDPLSKDEIAKDATCGFGVGYRIGFVFDIGIGEVTPFASADLMWNRMPREARNSFIKAGQSVPNYLNLPVLFGVNYRYALTDVVIPFVEFGLGYDFMMITKAGSKNTFIKKYSVGGAFAWQIGLGSYFGPHFSVGVHFYGLGLHGINERNQTEDNSLRNMNEFALRLGFHF